MDEEPSADVGIAGALQLAMKKGNECRWNVHIILTLWEVTSSSLVDSRVIESNRKLIYE